MKPQYIFIAVVAICIGMAAALPNLASSQPVAAAVPDSLPAEPVVAGVVESGLVNEQAAPKQSQAVSDQPQAAPEKPQAAPDEPPVFEYPAEPYAERPGIPVTASLDAFIDQMATGREDQLVGVYVEGIFALQVREQPGGQESFVSAEDNTVTRYTVPSAYGVTALLAHNYLSGRAFIDLRPGQEIVLVYGDRRLERYSVSSIQNYQALSPDDIRSDFRDINGPNGGLLSYAQLFDQVYTTSGTLVLQTCLEANGILSWGRTFIIAAPAP